MVLESLSSRFLQTTASKNKTICIALGLDLEWSRPCKTEMFALFAVLSHLHYCANFLDEEKKEVTDTFFMFSGKSS